MGHVTANIVQQSFRGREDDGSETAATWIAAVNTNWSQDVNTNFRVRFLVQETAGGAQNNEQIQLEYNLGGAGWNAVNSTSSVVRSSASANFTDNDNTTQQLGSGTFITPNEGMDETNGLSGEGNTIDFVGNDEVEVEYCVQIRGVDVVSSDTIQLRVTNAGVVLDGYTNTPTVTVVEGSNTDVPLDNYGYNATGYSGNASYFIPVATGSYTLSGQTLGVSFETNTNVPLNTGAYTLAGQTLGVTIADNTAVPLDSYGYSLTGNSATINVGDAIELTGGAYTLAGQTLTINTTATTTVPLDSYGYNLTGYSGTASYYIPVSTGAYTVNGQTLSISTVGNTDVPLDAFAYALSGLALGVVVERPVALDAGAYTVAGQTLAVNTIGNTTVALDSYGYNLTGYSGTASYYIPVATGAYTVAGQTLGVTVDTGTSVPLDAGAYTLAGYELAFTPEIVGGTGDYVLAGQTLGVTIGADVTVPLDAYGYTLTGLAATIAVDDEIALDGYGYTLAGQALGVSSGVNIVADAGSYTVTGNALNITVGDAIGLDAGAYTLTGNALGVSATGDTAVALDAGAYTLTGLDATLSQSATTVSLDAGAYIFAGKDIASQVGAADTDACREPVQIVEIVQPLCANVFGSAPCTASLGLADTSDLSSNFAVDGVDGWTEGDTPTVVGGGIRVTATGELVTDQANRTLLQWEGIGQAVAVGASRTGIDAYHPELEWSEVNPGTGQWQADENVLPYTGQNYTASMVNNTNNLTTGIKLDDAVPSRLDLGSATDYTVEFYVYHDGTQSNNTIFSYYGAFTNYYFNVNSTERIQFLRWSGSFDVTQTTSAVIGSWVHYAMCVTGNTNLQIWVNGTRVVNTTMADMNGAGPYAFSIGGLANANPPTAYTQSFDIAGSNRIGPIHIWKGFAKYDGASITPDFPEAP